MFVQQVDRIVGYGPTETTVCASFFPLPLRMRQNEPVPIGKAVANYAIYLLDEHRRPVPLGVPGELWWGEMVVARGYWKNRDLTEDRFMSDYFLH